MSSLTLLRRLSQGARTGTRLPAALGVSLALLVASGCANELATESDLDFEVKFLCPSDKVLADQLHLIIQSGSCMGPDVHNQVLSHGDLARPTGELAPGEYGFRAMALRAGAVLAEGCVAAKLPARRAVVVELASDACLELPAAARQGSGNGGTTGNTGTGGTGPDNSVSALDGGVQTAADGAVSATPQPTQPTGCTGSGCTTTTPVANPAGAKCTDQRFGEHDYKFCAERVTWNTARNRCRALGMSLVSIESAPENEFVRGYSGGVNRWIGANDLSKGDLDFLSGFGIDPACANTTEGSGEGYWFWAGKEANAISVKPICSFTTAAVEADAAVQVAEASCVPVAGAYQNWQAEQPDNLVGALCLAGQDCGLILPDGTWDDGTCNVIYAPFVCETP